MVLDTFESLFPEVVKDESVLRKRKAEYQGNRETLRVYETLPAQMLNAYGMASYSQMPHDKVWEEMNKPLRSGARYMTELCSADPDRRGVGINRFLQVLCEYLKYQASPAVRAQNEFILKPEHMVSIYKEVDALLPRIQYLLAGKKPYVKQGSASLRTAVSLESDGSASKTQPRLKEEAMFLYKWLQLPQSRLRMLIQWQSAGGLPYVCGTHLLASNVFVAMGNKCHPGTETGISQEEFQTAILKRHQSELDGHSYSKHDEHAGDFAPLSA